MSLGELIAVASFFLTANIAIAAAIWKVMHTLFRQFKEEVAEVVKPIREDVDRKLDAEVWEAHHRALEGTVEKVKCDFWKHSHENGKVVIKRS
ncbi:MAG: hypothetical protein DRN14_07945 [Thermoplasmata archaeon]|nr:MAG: hypothetical protein DRN14_07945 [Thermoplasmata archaeon]